MAQIADWYLEFAAAVVAALPTEIEEATARRWAQDPDGLREMLAPLAEDSGIAPLRQDKSQDGWTLIKDVEEPKAITGADIEGVNFPEGTEDIIGEPIVAMIQEMDGLLGQRHAEYLMEHTGGIAEALERYALVFPGTIWQSPDQNHQVPCLMHRNGAWDLIFGILEGGFDSRDRLAQVRFE